MHLQGWWFGELPPFTHIAPVSVQSVFYLGLLLFISSKFATTIVAASWCVYLTPSNRSDVVVVETEQERRDATTISKTMREKKKTSWTKEMVTFLPLCHMPHKTPVPAHAPTTDTLNFNQRNTHTYVRTSTHTHTHTHGIYICTPVQNTNTHPYSHTKHMAGTHTRTHTHFSFTNTLILTLFNTQTYTCAWDA